MYWKRPATGKIKATRSFRVYSAAGIRIAQSGRLKLCFMGSALGIQVEESRLRLRENVYGNHVHRDIDQRLDGAGRTGPTVQEEPICQLARLQSKRRRRES